MNGYAIVAVLAGLGLAMWAAMRTEIEEIGRRIAVALIGLAILIIGIMYL